MSGALHKGTFLMIQSLDAVRFSVTNHLNFVYFSLSIFSKIRRNAHARLTLVPTLETGGAVDVRFSSYKTEKTRRFLVN